MIECPNFGKQTGHRVLVGCIELMTFHRAFYLCCRVLQTFLSTPGNDQTRSEAGSLFGGGETDPRTAADEHDSFAGKVHGWLSQAGKFIGSMPVS